MSESNKHKDWLEFIREVADNGKDRYGQWTVDIETHTGWDTLEDDDDHFDDNEDLFEI